MTSKFQLQKTLSPYLKSQCSRDESKRITSLSSSGKPSHKRKRAAALKCVVHLVGSLLTFQFRDSIKKAGDGAWG